MIMIWKTSLHPVSQQEIEVPQGAEFLHVAVQHDKPCLWFKCNTLLPKEKRAILMCYTGDEVPAKSPSKYIGTILLHSQVYHVLELKKEERNTKATQP